MKFVASFLLVLASVAALAQSPASQSPADKFVGTWEAVIDDEPFLTFILSKKDDEIVGTIIQDDFDLSDDGEITNVQPTHRKTKIVSTELAGKKLKIMAPKNNQGDKIRYLLDTPEDGETKVYILIGGYDAPQIPPVTVKKKAGK